MFSEDVTRATFATDAETAALFGDLVIQNMQHGADVDTVAEWARYAARYGAKALRREELRTLASHPSSFVEDLLSDMNRMNAVIYGVPVPKGE